MVHAQVRNLFTCPDAENSLVCNKLLRPLSLQNVSCVLEHVYQQSGWLVPVSCTDMPLPCVGVSHGQSPNRDQG